MKKQNYLVFETIYFIDPHGSPDTGETIKFVTNNPVFGFLNKEDYYNSRFDPKNKFHDEYWMKKTIKNRREDTENWGSEDGYNYTAYGYRIKKISEEKAAEYTETIKAYNKIK